MMAILEAMLINKMIITSAGGTFGFGASATTGSDSPGIDERELATARAIRVSAIYSASDEIGGPAKLKIETRVNVKVEQTSNTSMLTFSIPRLINYSSTIFDLESERRILRFEPTP